MREITTTITCYDKSSPTTGVIGGNLVKQGSTEKRLLFTAAEMIGSYSAGQLLKVKMAGNVSENDENNILVQRLPADGVFGTLSNATNYVLLQKGIDGYYYADLEKLRTVDKTETFDCVIRLKNDSATGVQIFAYATTSFERQYEPKLMLLQGDAVAEEQEKKPVVFERAVGENGRYQINLVKQKTDFNIDLFSAYGYCMPMSVALVYHENMIDNQSDFGCHLGFGNGWKLNYQQYIVVRGHECLYVDASGHCRRFLRMINSSDIWYDETGSGFVLKKVGGILLLEHEDGVKYTFNAYDDYVYRLTKIENGYMGNITFTYAGNDLTQITDGMGRTATLVYNAQDFVSSITTPDQKTIEFSYATIGGNTMLSSISSFEVSATIGYNTENKLSRVEFSTGEIVEFNTITGDGIYTHSITESLKTTNASPAQSVIETFRYGKAEDGKYKVKDSKDKVYVYRYVDGTIPNVQFIAAHEDVATAPMNQFPISDYESFRTYCKTVGAQPLTAPSEPIVLTNVAAYGSTGQSHVWNVDPLFFSKRGLKRGTYCIDYSYRFQFAECEQARNATGAIKLSVVCKVGNTIVGNPDLMIDVPAVPTQATSTAASITEWKHSYLTFSLPLDVDVTSVTATFQNLIAHSTVQIANVKFVSTQSHQWNWGGGSHSGSNLANCEISPSGTYQNAATIDYPAYPTTSFQYTNTAGTTNTVYYDELSQRDWLKNLRSYANKNADGSFTLWYNDNRKCIKNAKNVAFRCKKDNGNTALVSAATVMDNLIAVYHDSECVRVKKYTVTGAEDVYLTEEETLYNTKGKFTATTTYNDKMQPITVTDFEGKTLTYEYDTCGNVSKKTVVVDEWNSMVLEEQAFEQSTTSALFTKTEKARIGSKITEFVTTYNRSNGTPYQYKTPNDLSGREENYDYFQGNLSSIRKKDATATNRYINYTYTFQNDLESCACGATKFAYEYGVNGAASVYAVTTANNEETQTPILQEEILCAEDPEAPGGWKRIKRTYPKAQSSSGDLTAYDRIIAIYDAYDRLIEVRLICKTLSDPWAMRKIYWIYSDEDVEMLDSVIYSDNSASSTAKLRKVIDNLANVVYTYHYSGDGSLAECRCYKQPSAHANYRTEENLLTVYSDFKDRYGRLAYTANAVKPTGGISQTAYTYRELNTNYSEQIATFTAACQAEGEQNAIDSATTAYEYDAYDRPTGFTQTFVKAGAQQTRTHTKAYTYYARTSIVNGETHTEESSSIKREEDCIKPSATQTQHSLLFMYDYDDAGNVNSVIRTSKHGTTTTRQTTEYLYDGWNRLLREVRTVSGATVYQNDFFYDENGNMVMRWKNNGTTITEIPYVYDDRNRLISYNGQTIAYDDFGNPLNWRNLTNLNYKHRRLISCTAGADQLQYAYNGNGMRVSKTVNGEETERYYYQGNNLVGIWRKAGNHMQFVYDQTGVCGTWYNGQLYSFTKNVFGDITGIIAGDGTLTALYEYDAWGNCTVVKVDTDEDYDIPFVGNVNPFRYRGYFYDVETGFYYQQTRYYDSVVCRFLTPDNTDYLEPTTFGGLNLYAYCYNNPIGIAYSSSGVGFSTSGKMMSSLAISGSNILGYGSSNKGYYWPNLDFLGTGFGYIENSFSTIAGVIDGVRKIKHLDKLAGLDKASKWLMVIGIGINVGLSLYNNLTNSNLSSAQKAGNIVGDIVYIAASSAATWGVSALTAMIPVVGPFLAPVVGFGFGTALDQFWHGEDIFGIEGFSFKPGGKSIDEWIKEFLTELFGG